MPQTISVSAKILEDILLQLIEVKRDVAFVKKEIQKKKRPKEGSEDWWKIETKKAQDEVARGEYYEFDNADEAIKFLHSNS